MTLEEKVFEAISEDKPMVFEGKIIKPLSFEGVFKFKYFGTNTPLSCTLWADSDLITWEEYWSE